MNIHNYIYTAAGLALFYVGLRIFAGGMKVLAVPDHLNLFLGSQMWMFVGGVLVTMLWQSSSLSTTAIVALVASSAVKLPAAVAFVLGANIATSFTAHIAAAFVSNGYPSGDAARIAVVHTAVNTAMAVVLLPFCKQIAQLVSKF